MQHAHLVRSWILLPLVLGACSSPHPLPIQEIPETFREHPGPGTPGVWDDLWADVQEDGRHRAALIEKGDDALLLRLNLIRSARESIRIQTFAWKDDESGRLVLWELLKAASQRGVEVQILADEAFLEFDIRKLAALAEFDPGLEIRVYNPSGKHLTAGVLRVLRGLAVDPRKLNIRMHNKVMVVDDRFAISGGRNYSNKYFDRVLGLNFKDRDILVAGPEAERAGASFQEYWDHPWAIPVTGLAEVADILRRNDPLMGETGTDFDFRHLFDDLLPRVQDAREIRDWLARHARSVDEVQFHADRPTKNDSGGFDGGSHLAEVLTELLNSATEEVVIQSPYLALSTEAIQRFRRARSLHPDLSVLVSTNSLAATDSWQTYAFSYKQKRLYLEELGFQIWEFMPVPANIHEMMDYRPLLQRRPTPAEIESPEEASFELDPALPSLHYQDADGTWHSSDSRRNEHTEQIPFLCLHQKSLVIDGRRSFVGSYNLDPRSGNLNTEVGFSVEDEGFAEELKARIVADASPGNSFRVAPREAPESLHDLLTLAQQTSESSPVDLWPIRHTASFRLRRGVAPVEPGHPEFYDRWQSMGSFPLLGPLSDKVLFTRFLKAFGATFSPLVQLGQPEEDTEELLAASSKRGLGRREPAERDPGPSLDHQ